MNYIIKTSIKFIKAGSMQDALFHCISYNAAFPGLWVTTVIPNYFWVRKARKVCLSENGARLVKLKLELINMINFGGHHHSGVSRS